MTSNEIFLRSAKGLLYLSTFPVIFLSAMVWFSNNSIGIIIAHCFQIYFCAFLSFISGYVWSLKKKKDDDSFWKSSTLFVSLLFLIIIISLIIYAAFSPAWSIGFSFTCIFCLRHYRFSKNFKDLFPASLRELINKISVMLCICLMIMLAYWLNPYTEPLKQLL
jgi:hypothetical protein|tara:strand:- start:5128 stop:5619 length:492 start_codon:yes stop_codon:yes gene_type:complete